MCHILVVGVGNLYRSDDAVGIIVARRLREKIGACVTVREESGEGTALLESWKGVDTVILIDATQSGATPGTLQRFDVNVQPLPATFFRHSTHAFSAAEAIELARALGQLPSRFIVYGIEGKTFLPGVGLSGEVEVAIEEAVQRVRQEIAYWTAIEAEGM
jgi:hydrogenase maturation protease